ncbi:protein kinase [Nonomuraea sp. NPDC046802]|uniref:serine/threonine protein kinase n=1 Tax=Nonomuraea sp. NPDC046802 TaxID=3154919 RepID=UPI0033E19162
MPNVEPPRQGDPEAIAAYRIVGRLGEGGQGIVYLGQGPDGRYVAVKVLRQPSAGDDRFAKEIAAARRVEPFCIAQVLDASLGAHPYIVSEYVEGPSLQQTGRHYGTDLQRLAVGTATALSAIHRAGVVHRDFKPANVLLGQDGPRVIDFGIARAADAAVTVTSSIVGTPAYMAPEQLAGAQVGPAADVFAWACVIVFAGTGTPPFGNDTLPAVINRILSQEPFLGDLPEPLRSVVYACLAKDPAARPHMQDVLLRLIGGSREPTHPPHGGAQPGPWPSAASSPQSGPWPSAASSPQSGAAGGPQSGPSPMAPGGQPAAPWPAAGGSWPASGGGQRPGSPPVPAAGGRRGLPLPVVAGVSGALAVSLAAGVIVWNLSRDTAPAASALTAGSSEPSPTPSKPEKTTSSTPKKPRATPKTTRPRPTSSPSKERERTTPRPTRTPTPTPKVTRTPTKKPTTARPSPTKTKAKAASFTVDYVRVTGKARISDTGTCHYGPQAFGVALEGSEMGASFSYQWLVDGQVIESGSRRLPSYSRGDYFGSKKEVNPEFGSSHTVVFQLTSPVSKSKSASWKMC